MVAYSSRHQGPSARDFWDSSVETLEAVVIRLVSMKCSDSPGARQYHIESYVYFIFTVLLNVLQVVK